MMQAVEKSPPEPGCRAGPVRNGRGGSGIRQSDRDLRDRNNKKTWQRERIVR